MSEKNHPSAALELPVRVNHDQRRVFLELPPELATQLARILAAYDNHVRRGATHAVDGYDDELWHEVLSRILLAVDLVHMVQTPALVPLLDSERLQRVAEGVSLAEVDGHRPVYFTPEEWERCVTPLGRVDPPAQGCGS